MSTKDLGVTMDNWLVFDQHVANIVHTACSRVYLTLRSFCPEIAKSLSKPILSTSVQPILEYCSVV